MGKKGRKRGRDEFQEGVGAEEPVKRKRQVTTEKLQLYKLYEDLAAESDEVRLEAAKQLILKFSPESEPAAADVQEVLNRLIKGLCTQRKAARFGFCVTLTELLRQLLPPSKCTIKGLDLDVYSFLKRVERQTKVEGNVAGVVRPLSGELGVLLTLRQERRDHLIGKLFAYKAIIQSAILIEPELFLEGWNELLDRIYGMAHDVPWLREECGLILVQTIESLGSKANLEPCAQGLVQRLVTSNLVNTPEGVAIWLALRASNYEGVLPTNIWIDNDPLSKKERTRLAKVLRENYQGGSVNGKSEDVKSAAAHANPSFAWDVLLSKVLEMDENKKNDRTDSDKSEFARFWLDTVDGTFVCIS
jgi:DNA polymerase phi